MKVLLIGEYSRLHNSLKEGLIKHGHEVLLVGTGDGFKNYPVDINIKPKIPEKSLLFFFEKIFFKLFKISLSQFESAFRFYKILHLLKGFDIVQLINENSISTHPKLEIWLLKKLISQNKKLFLLSCGTDFISVEYSNKNFFKYSILTPLKNNPSLKKHYIYVLKYITKRYKKLHEFVYSQIEGVISSDMDYHIPLVKHPKYLGLIPNPINIDKISFISNNLNSKIVIFHGINRLNYIKKGNAIFEEALEIIKEKYADKITILTSESLPYAEYIKMYESCHILLDQVYAYDQGYNALEAMARGKVVFTGAEKEWLDYYNLKENTVAINALPDANKISEKLEWLILNPKEIEKISINARAFIEKEHDYLSISSKYIDTWQTFTKEH
ncbi:glycosyltransferase [uncultured Algibacter sp.]|uniref:glycosyltransferase n=1 Tax=uncultured Algibacter sp. TaxID=298659 RepID=UPI00262B7352|nr:glycosyltransferase [uncultured Algibacter sp.]